MQCYTSIIWGESGMGVGVGGGGGLLGVAPNGSDRGEHETLLGAVVFRDAPHDLHQLSGEPMHIAGDCNHKCLHSAVTSARLADQRG